MSTNDDQYCPPLALSGTYGALKQALRCPLCGETNLHQGRVHVFDRPEDGATIETIVRPPGAEAEGVATKPIQRPTPHNPSPRRVAVAIEFYCEHCTGPVGQLQIVQHKGTEYISWATPTAQEVQRELKAAEASVESLHRKAQVVAAQ